jgi:hypothetical protein
MGRDRRERFVALAEARTARALGTIRLLGNLSNRSNYEYTEADVAQIIRALEHEVKAVKARFADASTGRDQTFRLNESKQGMD